MAPPKNSYKKKTTTIYYYILLYNSGTWGLTKKEQNEIDVTHRRQLRTLINNKKICNNKLYKNVKKKNKCNYKEK